MTISDIDASKRSVGVVAPPDPLAPDQTLLESVEAGAERILLEGELRPRRWRGRLLDLTAILSFVVAAFSVTSSMWMNSGHELAEDPQDQAFFEWMMAHGARVVTDFVYPFVSYQMNVPDGINMMANTSVLAISIPMTPITLAFGPHASFMVFLTGALILTGLSWYLVLSRHLVSSRMAAWVGALLCAFAPSMISHANGHPNIVAQFLVPVIIWRTLCLKESGRSVRNGVLLGLVIVWQAFINLEILFMTAVGLGIFVAVVAFGNTEHRRNLKPFMAGLSVAGSLALVLLAYPLWVQFFGPQSYHGLAHDIRAFGADLGSFLAYSRRSIAGSAETAAPLAQNASEENAFFGWGLTVLFFALVIWMRRSIVVVALATVALLFAALSLGPQVSFNGRPTRVASLWALLHDVPVLNSAVPTRWAMAIAPILGILLALGVQRANGLILDMPESAGPIKLATATALALALVPLTPTPLLTRPMAPAPEFITAGTWRQYVDDNHTVVTLPPADVAYPAPIRWSAMTGLDMRIPRGYFLAPNPEDNTALFSAPARPTSKYFFSIWAGYWVPKIDDDRREQTLADLQYWQAGVVILTPQNRDIELRRAMSDILGFQPKWIDGAWVWDVRHLTS